MNAVPEAEPVPPFDPAAAARMLDQFEDDGDFDVAATERIAVEIEGAAEAHGETELVWRARLLRATMHEYRGDLAASARILSDVLAWADAHERRPVAASAHRMLARLHRAMGDMGASLDHSLQCVNAQDDTTPVSIRIACMIKLGDAFARTGSPDAARERYEEADRLAIETDNPYKRIMALNNYAYAEYEEGNGEQARAVLARLREVAQAHGMPLGFSVLDTVARVETLCGDHDAAERAALAALDALSGEDLTQDADAETDLLLTLALVQRRKGDLAAALRTVTQVQQESERLSLTYNAAQALFELSEIHAAAGDYKGAYLALSDFNAAQERLSSAEREVQARNRQVMFEVAEARRQAEWFREQALRDALTGLRNRRYVDEHLPALLHRAAAEGSPVTIALLDLDHFKRINDTLSHEAGDQVLTAVAGLLDTVETGPDGFAARLGGEEFLLVVRGTDPCRAVTRLEELRQSIAEHPWQPLTGELPVTISIGVSAATPDSTQRELLSEADEALYRAKRGGRNRVHLAPNATAPKRRRWRDASPLAS
ncbi:diguanylate cyclase (GGDEF)-like protein [Krasilnikovia cinnamomea]|uniref:Diguanylate cyclase (GGDEF)-like protein n=1 Tax=Krasilnikovia cinnamomea TaxID=349313 RepID=A0A4Q7ZNH8_9ACTN|nr:GGDEF domain-containing protein [Krasilnikovia cinnamomea]RZU52592.1 diguanylate cyclase (GGDEF)-like protein [Krasilnikovia cinnamomea]